MKFNVSYPLTGQQMSLDIQDKQKLSTLYDKRISQTVRGEFLGEQFHGYVLKIMGGQDKQGFPMRPGVLTADRVSLFIHKGTPGFRGYGARNGEKRRKSVRGCIITEEISVVNLVIVTRGDLDIPGLTDNVVPIRKFPKRAADKKKRFAKSVSVAEPREIIAESTDSWMWWTEDDLSDLPTHKPISVNLVNWEDYRITLGSGETASHRIRLWMSVTSAIVTIHTDYLVGNEGCHIFGKLLFFDDLKENPVILSCYGNDLNFGESLSHELVLLEEGLFSHRALRADRANHAIIWLSMAKDKSSRGAEIFDSKTHTYLCEEDLGPTFPQTFKDWPHSLCLYDDGFKLDVQHLVIYGCPVKVNVTVNKPLQIVGKGTSKMLCGRITACQNFKYSIQKQVVTLYYVPRSSSLKNTSRNYVMPLDQQGVIPLLRQVVVAPVAPAFLSIELDLWSGQTQVANEVVNFAYEHGFEYFLTNGSHTHTNDVLDGLFSVSITFQD